MEELSAIPVWLCIPFAGLLLSIAVMPLIKPDWWEKHQPLAVAFWSVLFIVPFAAKYGMFTMGETVLECVVNDYLTFIILLFGLFCVAGNITIDGEFAGSPRINTALFVLGTLLSSVIGTTGSSMLLVRPFIKMNSWRKRKSHIMIFFIFLISNMGGCLTPIGDPPLLMGFMRGVPFFWSLKLFHILIFNMIILLMLFYFLDRRAYRKDIAEGRKPDIREPGTHVRIVGLHNLIYVAMIVGAVILSGMLPGMSAFQNADGTVKGIHILGEVTLGFPSVIEIVIILLAAFLSFKTTKEEVRIRNHFTWGAIQEVAVLFIGIFITMQPALMILKANGAELGINKPFEMFWATGALSSFLDNTPTYLVFLTTAGALGFKSGVVTTLGSVPVKMLEAISCGAVFMGANTYIGNAPNFMVKSMSDENGVRMPSFFGYMVWSLTCLIPVFIIDMLDGEVYECVGSSLGRTFTGDKRTCVDSLVKLMRTKPQGHLLRSELALISNMARTIRKDEDRSRLMRKYDEILKEIAELPAGFGKVEILDENRAKLNTSNLRQKFSKDDHLIICIGRTHGSAGNDIGFALADALRINYYDAEIFNEVLRRLDAEKDSVVDVADLGTNEIENKYQGSGRTLKERLKDFDRYHGLTKEDAIFFNQSDLICKRAKEEDFIVMGRCADVILANNHIPHISIFITAPFEQRVHRVMEVNNLDHKKAERLLKKIDRQHSKYYNFYTGLKWGDAVNYDICFNSASYGIEESVEIIERMLNQHTNA